MSSVPIWRFCVAFALAAPFPAIAGPGTTIPAPAPTYRYADVADLTLKAPMVIVATVRDAARIKGAEAAKVAPGYVRLYLTVDVVALIRGPGAVPPQLGYLYDAKLDSRGQAPKLKKQRVLLFARPVASAADQVQLISDGAQLAWSPPTEATTRRIATDVVASDSPPAIAGISNAFHAAGSLPGEGETQIFLKTEGHPISLSIIRKQDQSPVWTVSLSEVVDNALPPPQRDTFLWYRLACGLPRELPADILSGLDPSDSAAIRDDYALVKTGLGACR
ncbi:hypothetical protein [Sphingomonas bacterium]|uniref:hypothetical protein n=1 Tax=Sphingomonas bacterium TaxID=1895847 RepID=UPI00262C67E4|nr:hypothetical protein [Sphingomonas bacterium]MDB5679457.1 hypothetical protein [Sphingomonas bacterium]